MEVHQFLSDRVDGTIATFAGLNHPIPGYCPASNMMSKAFLLDLFEVMFNCSIVVPLMVNLYLSESSVGGNHWFPLNDVRPFPSAYLTAL